MDVAAHPHIGLQTVTWLHEGEVVHLDSLGYESVLRPGSVNVMTSGDGIAHAEQTPRNNSGRLNGVQLWTALPDKDRRRSAHFVQITEVPVLESSSGIVQVFAGMLDGTMSPAPHYSDLLGADLQVHPGNTLVVALKPDHEHAVLVMNGDCALDGQPLEQRVLYYLGTTRAEAGFSSEKGGRLLLIGGPPFPETILMWWTLWRGTPRRLRRRVRTGKRSVDLAR